MDLVFYIALFAPLCGAALGLGFVNRRKFLGFGVLCSLCILASLICSILLLVFVAQGGVLRLNLAQWISVGELFIPFGFLIDSISAIMIFVVSLVSFCVFVYSIGYMSAERGFNRFFTYLCGFVFSMLFLVSADNFASLFIGWEGVGLCSWLLIGFYYEKNSASFAANEAFIMNRVADLGLLMGICLIFWSFGSLQFSEVFGILNGDFAEIAANSNSIESNFLIESNSPKAAPSAMILAIIGILLFIGAMGKSAQFPFHTWLADAMEGPTPVSALIHAATMVTAGVYLVIRAHPLYLHLENIGFIIAALGAFVALFAASLALVNTDLKRIIAYSTLSQLGYMFVAAGLGAYSIALFHLFTHAFFKSLLFLGAGNVMHAMNDKLDITKMGALKKPLKITAIFMILASIALCGIYPFSGFFSKDKILETTFGAGEFVLWAALLLGAFLTAFYSFRLIMLVFFGEKRFDKNTHPHEAPLFMLLAMSPLCVMAIFSGFLQEHFFSITNLALNALNSNTQAHLVPHLEPQIVLILAILTTFVSLCGIGFAVLKYRKIKSNNTNQSGAIRFNADSITASQNSLETTPNACFRSKNPNFLHKILKEQYFIPAFYNFIFVRCFRRLCEFLWDKIDKKIIDFIVDSIALALKKSGENLRVIQSGNLSLMLRGMVAGVVFLLVLVFVLGDNLWNIF